MQLNANGWDVPFKRDTALTPAMERPVFVVNNFGDQYPVPINNYEYSGDAPARLARTLDNLLYGVYNRQNFIQLFYNLPEVYAPVHEIAMRVADADWVLKRTMDDQVVEDKDFNRLFNDPNPLISGKQLIYQAVCYEILCGASLQFLNMPSSLPAGLSSCVSWMNIPTQYVTVNKKHNVDPYTATSIMDFINYYEAQNRKFDPKYVVNMANHNLMNPTEVDTWIPQLVGAKAPIRNLIPVYEARGTIYIKRGAMGFLVSGKQDESGRIALTPNEKKEIQNEYQTEYGITNGRTAVGVVSAPVDFVKTSMSIDELKPFDETLADALAIYAVLRVPRHLCPSKEQSTYANADADMKAFYEDTIIKIANRYAQKWTVGFGMTNRYIYPDFSKVGVLQENKKEKATVDQVNGNVYLQRFTSGTGTLNQWVIANGQEASTNPLYDKYIFDMDDTELEKIKTVLNIKVMSTGTPSKTGGPEKPTLEVQGSQAPAA